MPVGCNQGQKVSGRSCVNCSGNEVCDDPANPTTCADKTFNNIGCEPCPAGFSCSGGTSTACGTTGTYSILGATTCSNANKMQMAPTKEFMMSCPDSMFTFATR